MAASGRAVSRQRTKASASALREEDVDDYLEVPDVIGGQDGDYMLRLETETMRSAGFLAGDYVVVRPTKRADVGTIAVVVNGAEVTLMRACREGGELRLESEGEEATAMAIGRVSVLGRVVGLIRKV